MDKHTATTVQATFDAVLIQLVGNLVIGRLSLTPKVVNN